MNAIFSLLSGNRLVESCSQAVDNSDYRLALLLAQAGSNNTLRDMCKEQLKEWHHSGVCSTNICLSILLKDAISLERLIFKRVAQFAFRSGLKPEIEFIKFNYFWLETCLQLVKTRTHNFHFKL